MGVQVRWKMGDIFLETSQRKRVEWPWREKEVWGTGTCK